MPRLPPPTRQHLHELGAEEAEAEAIARERGVVEIDQRRLRRLPAG